MYEWMDATFAIESDTPLEVNAQGEDGLEVAWTSPTRSGVGTAGLSIRMDRPMAEDLRDQLDRILSPVPAEPVSI
jgi:hypothetical protein